VFCKKIILFLKSLGFKENRSDAGLLLKWHEGGIILIGFDVDDCRVMGNEEHITTLIFDLKKNGFNYSLKIFSRTI
jgi:hypothetical protein